MKMDEYFEIILDDEETKISDGMGGWTEAGGITTIGSILGLMLPISQELLLKNREIVSSHTMKIITKSHLPNDHAQDEILLRYVNYTDNIFQNYKIIQVSDYGKYKMLLVEKVD